MPNDKILREEFCYEMMERANADREFISCVCFTDECTFTLNNEPNHQNVRNWSQTNPHLMLANHTQYPQKLNVWAGILRTHIIGPFFIEGALNGRKYLELLRNEIAPAVEEVAGEHTIFYQHDGCPAHYFIQVRDCLNEFFPNSWIGRGGTISWPPRSPDLPPNDFFLWGHLKSKVYSHTTHATLDSLRAAIIVECGKITDRQLANTRRNFYDRIGHCLAVNGDVFEHLI